MVADDTIQASASTLLAAEKRVRQVLLCLKESLPEIEGLEDISLVETTSIKDHAGTIVGSLIEPGELDAQFYFGVEIVYGIVVAISIQQKGRWSCLTGKQFSVLLYGTRRSRFALVERLTTELFG